MTIDEAIEHYIRMATQRAVADEGMGESDKWNETKFMTKKESEQIIADNRQLAKWLTELKDLRELREAYKRLLKAAVDDMYNSVNDVHCKYCSKWHTDQCQRTSHLECYIENKFKWRYSDEAEKLLKED